MIYVIRKRRSPGAEIEMLMYNYSAMPVIAFYPAHVVASYFFGMYICHQVKLANKEIIKATLHWYDRSWLSPSLRKIDNEYAINIERFVL